MVHISHRLLQVVVIFLTKLHNSVFAIKALANHFICLYKLVDLPRQLVVLMADDADVIVHRVNFNLQVCIVLQEGAVRVSGSLQLLAHVQKLVFLLSNLNF